MTVQPHPGRPVSHFMGCVGFWLWALVVGGLVIGLTSFVAFLLIPPVVGAVLLMRLSRWDGGPVLLGLIAGVGLFLLVAGMIAFAIAERRRS